jgi:spore maturation protein SpmB
MDVISIIMAAGKSSVDVALYTLLPIMVIMLIIMKYLEVRGILDVIVRWVAAAEALRLNRDERLRPDPD